MFFPELSSFWSIKVLGHKVMKFMQIKVKLSKGKGGTEGVIRSSVVCMGAIALPHLIRIP